jgi:hypothetical protein
MIKGDSIARRFLSSSAVDVGGDVECVGHQVKSGRSKQDLLWPGTGYDYGRSMLGFCFS